MKSRVVLWVAAPVVLSVGVIWLSAQEARNPADGIKVAEVAEKLQLREKVAAQKETELRELEQRLLTLQTTLNRDREDLSRREQALQEAQTKLEQLKARPPIDPQLIRTYEAMEPLAGAQALRELTGLNPEVAVSLLAGMQPKKAARLMDQLAGLNAKLAGQLSEKVAQSRPKEEKK